MGAPPSFLQDVDLVILDMDGVLTSEDAYWDTAGLVIQDLLESPAYLGLSPPHYTPIVEGYYQRLSKSGRSDWRKYLPSEMILHCKARGINSNWDLAYLVAGIYLASLFRPALKGLYAATRRDVGASPPEGEDSAHEDWIQNLLPRLKHHLEPVWEDLLNKTRRGEWNTILRVNEFHGWGGIFREQKITMTPVQHIELRIMDDFHPDIRGLQLLDELNRWLDPSPWIHWNVFGRETALWEDCRDLFQTWYLGEALYESVYHRPVSYRPKPGLVHGEEPLLGRKRTHDCLERLTQAGITLGISTGRPRIEIMTPLQEWGMERYFDPARISTYTDIEEAEEALRSRGIESALSKPHPFVFLRSILPGQPPETLARFDGRLEEARRVLIVGDAQADIWAAQQIGCPCAALLSGAIGPDSRRHLEQAHPDLICQDMEELTGLILRAKRKQ